MSNGNFGRCSSCGCSIIWIKTPAGKNMPCNAYIHNYKIDPKGKEKIVTPSGKVVTGTTDIDAADADGFGYISHFATCANAKRFRRGSR